MTSSNAAVAVDYHYAAGGLLYLTIDGVICIPCYDSNGNITR